MAFRAGSAGSVFFRSNGFALRAGQEAELVFSLPVLALVARGPFYSFSMALRSAGLEDKGGVFLNSPPTSDSTLPSTS